MRKPCLSSKMAAIGANRQVIAITHFPQVASLAKHHFVVSKEVEANRTRSTIRQIEGEERVEEFARMLGGSELNCAPKRTVRSTLDCVQPAAAFSRQPCCRERPHHPYSTCSAQGPAKKAVSTSVKAGKEA